MSTKEPETVDLLGLDEHKELEEANRNKVNKSDKKHEEKGRKS